MKQTPIYSRAKVANKNRTPFTGTCISVLVLALFFPFIVSAQTNPLNRKVTLHITNTSLGDALYIIGESAGFHFSYNATILPEDSLVNIKTKRVPVKSVLDQILGKSINMH